MVLEAWFYGTGGVVLWYWRRGFKHVTFPLLYTEEKGKQLGHQADVGPPQSYQHATAGHKSPAPGSEVAGQ